MTLGVLGAVLASGLATDPGNAESHPPALERGIGSMGHDATAQHRDLGKE